MHYCWSVSLWQLIHPMCNALFISHEQSDSVDEPDCTAELWPLLGHNQWTSLLIFHLYMTIYDIIHYVHSLTSYCDQNINLCWGLCNMLYCWPVSIWQLIHAMCTAFISHEQSDSVDEPDCTAELRPTHCHNQLTSLLIFRLYMAIYDFFQ